MAAAAVLVGVSGVSLPESQPAAPAPVAGRSGLAPGSAVRALLERRADAVLRRDEAAFSATVDPLAPADFQQHQLALFRNLAAIPFAQLSFELDSTAEPGLAADTWVPPVRFQYALANVDSVPTRRPLGYVFARRGGSWYVADDRGNGSSRGWRGPWDFGPCHVARPPSGLVIGHRAAAVERVARLLGAAVADVTEVWGTGWSQRVGVVLAETAEELRALVGPEFAVEGIAAVAVADRVDTAARRVEGPRVVLTPRAAEQLSDAALGVVLRHEITHIAARADTVEGAPRWMLEGFADYVGYRESGVAPPDIAPELVRRLREDGPPHDLPDDGDFHQGGRRLDLAYQQSWSVVRHLAERLGEPRLVHLYRRVALTRDPGEVDAILREETGMTTRDLAADWAAALPADFHP
ncbi:hypothetical protein [Saccharopolyspora thermophila]|uniref:Basic secretory peptidase family protein n=1 Tax=Saccharopolyspora thermophila TaxID=89367 RepID=A0ABP3NB51_9PSEU